MLARKPFEQRSAKFDRYAQNNNRHTSRWNYRNDGDWDHGYSFSRRRTRASSATRPTFSESLRAPAVWPGSDIS